MFPFPVVISTSLIRLIICHVSGNHSTIPYKHCRVTIKVKGCSIPARVSTGPSHNCKYKLKATFHFRFFMYLFCCGRRFAYI